MVATLATSLAIELTQLIGVWGLSPAPTGSLTWTTCCSTPPAPPSARWSRCPWWRCCASGVGAFLVLGSVEQLGFAYFGFVLLSLGWVMWSRDHLGQSHTLARMDLIVERQPTAKPTSDNG